VAAGIDFKAPLSTAGGIACCRSRNWSNRIASRGNTGSTFECSYHAWTFHLDGRVKGIPLSHGYAGTRMTPDNPDCSMKAAARVDSYRGFVFASLAATGPSLLEFGDRAMAREGGNYSMEEMTELKWITIQLGQRQFPF
jgi:phenylpropionate dioxygenase-like ring-hydroxylating dioxygenase large terminal subunit